MLTLAICNVTRDTVLTVYEAFIGKGHGADTSSQSPLPVKGTLNTRCTPLLAEAGYHLQRPRNAEHNETRDTKEAPVSSQALAGTLRGRKRVQKSICLTNHPLCVFQSGQSSSIC